MSSPLFRSSVMLLLFVTACGGFMSSGANANGVEPSVVQKESSADLGCPVRQIHVEKISNTSWKATGCGSTASYQCWTSVGMGEGTCVHTH
jgi:hypothetical protein